MASAVSNIVLCPVSTIQSRIILNVSATKLFICPQYEKMGHYSKKELKILKCKKINQNKIQDLIEKGWGKEH